MRDRFRSEVIVSSTAMTRHIDYDIDVTAGTIRFREPVLSRDADRNPVFIVVDYETYGNSRRDVAGVRAVTRIADKRAQLGVTALHDRTAGKGDLIAVDARARIARNTEVRGEAAMSSTQASAATEWSRRSTTASASISSPMHASRISASASAAKSGRGGQPQDRARRPRRDRRRARAHRHRLAAGAVPDRRDPHRGGPAAGMAASRRHRLPRHADRRGPRHRRARPLPRIS
ncbi:hypothetical protein AB5I41_25840 [Sphingomonas sp. MMS24-JH45]